MSGFNSNKRRRTIGEDYNDPGFSNQSANAVSSVEILPNINTHRVSKGGDRLPQFVNEPPQSVDVVVSSQNRVNGSLFNFSVDIGSTVFRPRLVTVDAVVLPKIPNITSQNNQVKMQAAFIPLDASNPNQSNGVGFPSPVVEFTLPTGYYGIDNIVDLILNGLIDAVKKSGPNAQAQLKGWNFIDNRYYHAYGGDFQKWSLDFDAFTNTTTLRTMVNNLGVQLQASFDPSGNPQNAPPASGDLVFWFVDSCSFIQRGKNFMPFVSYPELPRATPPQTWKIPEFNSYDWNSSLSRLQSQTSTQSIFQLLKSGLSGLQYTRFCTLSSNSLNRFSYDESRVTRIGSGGGSGKIIAVLDTSFYEIDDEEFAGSFLPVQYPNSAVININNAQGQLEQFLDFIVRDEYGSVLDDIFPHPANAIGITFWLKITF